jgi:hypothetical protein
MAPVPSPARDPGAQPERKFITLDPGLLDRYEGFYPAAPDLTIQVVKQDGNLLASAAGLDMLELKAITPPLLR